MLENTSEQTKKTKEHSNQIREEVMEKSNNSIQAVNISLCVE